MNGELQELYQQVILDHNKNPRNFGKIESCTHSAEGNNPLCGDHIEIDLDVRDGIIKDVKFRGAGCAISKASASIMTTILKGKHVEDSKKLFDEFHEIVTGEKGDEQDLIDLGKLAVFCGVREFPARVKCASLAWHTMKNALDKEVEKVASTE